MRTRRMLTTGRALVLLSAGLFLTVAACSGAHGPCGPGGRPWRPPFPVVKTTVEPDGTIVDWMAVQSPAAGGAFGPPAALSAEEGSAAVPNSVPSDGPVSEQLVPIRRPKGLRCHCSRGYRALPGGPCESTKGKCAGPGQTVSARGYYQSCCPGLQMVALEEERGGECMPVFIHASQCIQCGDGVCGAGENSCNCPKDCPKP